MTNSSLDGQAGSALEAVAVVRTWAPDDASLAARCRRAWRLTEAESQIAGDVARGRAVQMIAQDRGVSVHTVRTQLKRVLAKSGCHRQLELAIRIREL